MKKLLLTIIILIGLYSLLRGNVGKIGDQAIWSINPDFFNNVFVPLGMVLSSFFSLLKNEKKNLFYIAFSAMLIDVTMRFSIAVNHFYMFMVYGHPSLHETTNNVISIPYNYRLWPSHIMGLVELLLIYAAYKFILKKKT